MNRREMLAGLMQAGHLIGLYPLVRNIPAKPIAASSGTATGRIWVPNEAGDYRLGDCYITRDLMPRGAVIQYYNGFGRWVTVKDRYHGNSPQN